MKEVIGQLKDFIKAQSPWHWLILMSFCAVSVYINYYCGLEERIGQYRGMKEFFAYSAMYAVHSIFAYLLYSCFSGNFRYWKKPGFLLLLLLSFFIFSFRAVTYQHADIIESFSTEGQKAINCFVFNDIFRLLYLFIPVTIVWFFADRDMPLYGVSLKNHKPRLYWMLLLCMIPLIAGASVLSDFLDYYPRFKKLQAYDPPAWKIWVYEICYGLDFTSIELFFRGFMVIAFARYVGMNAILPMAAFYLSIHYGKPMGESISSFFGGTILGVISYHSRSIFGGIMVHAGIAWLMEIGGYIGNLFRHTVE
jgi:hypothetical protein